MGGLLDRLRRVCVNGGMTNASGDEPRSAARRAGTMRDGSADEPVRSRYNVRLPRFVAEEPVGLGDVVKRVTSTAGVKPCGDCERRAERLNRWMSFGPHGNRGGSS